MNMINERAKERIMRLLNAKCNFHIYNYSNNSCECIEYVNVSFTFGYIYFSVNDTEILEFDESDYKEIFEHIQNWKEIAIEYD